eukprot:134446-Pleurochrysis_carterae.AAC.6
MPMPKHANANKLRINDNQSRNLQSQTDPRDRGRSASIARPRKSSTLPMKTAMTLYYRSNYLHKIYRNSCPTWALYGMTYMEIDISM